MRYQNYVGQYQVESDADSLSEITFNGSEISTDNESGRPAPDFRSTPQNSDA
jgi:hypothetical protein